MVPDWATKFLPDGLQSTKQLASYGANAFFALFVVQVLGLDLARFGLSPVIDWKTSGMVFCAFAVVQYILGGVQDKKLHEKIGNGTGNGHGSNPPTKPPGV